MDIVTLAAARKGSGGGASKEYVDEKVAALINDNTAAQNKTYSSAKIEDKVKGEEITASASAAVITLSDSADSNPLNLTIHGKSEIVDNSIISAGGGWGIIDLGSLTYEYDTTTLSFPVFHSENISLRKGGSSLLLTAIYETKPIRSAIDGDMQIATWNTANSKALAIRNVAYTDPTAFRTAMNGIYLVYELAAPTQGNALAVKSDNGTGVNGTMATFSTGMPLRSVDTVEDTLTVDGNGGDVVTRCGDRDMSTLTWETSGDGTFSTFDLRNYIASPSYAETPAKMTCPKYETVALDLLDDKKIACTPTTGVIIIKDTDYIDETAFTASLAGVHLVFELATPITTPLSAAEVAQFKQLQTYDPNTAVSNNATAVMSIHYYKNTDNGKAVKDIQSEIDGKITVSPALSLTVAGWSNNAQTVTFSHDTAKRNVIDVDPASVEEWAACGVLATAETATTITFTCKTTPTNALTFRVTSMGV